MSAERHINASVAYTCKFFDLFQIVLNHSIYGRYSKHCLCTHVSNTLTKAVDVRYQSRRVWMSSIAAIHKYIHVSIQAMCSILVTSACTYITCKYMSASQKHMPTVLHRQSTINKVHVRISMCTYMSASTCKCVSLYQNVRTKCSARTIASTDMYMHVSMSILPKYMTSLASRMSTIASMDMYMHVIVVSTITSAINIWHVQFSRMHVHVKSKKFESIL